MSEKKVIVITGAAQGIGLAAVKKYVKEGWAVAATDIKKEQLDGESTDALMPCSMTQALLAIAKTCLALTRKKSNRPKM